MWVGESWLPSMWVGESWLPSMWVREFWLPSMWVGKSWLPSMWVGDSWLPSMWVSEFWLPSMWVWVLVTKHVSPWVLVTKRECFEGAGQQIPIFVIEWKHTAGVWENGHLHMVNVWHTHCFLCHYGDLTAAALLKFNDPLLSAPLWYISHIISLIAR